MEKIILVDGNNLLFRSYYATAYSGNFMKNSKGFPTNALYGFTNMINKIINEYFDIRHNEYLNKAKQKREVLNDKDFIEYLYNRIYSLLFLLRIKCNNQELNEI